MSSAKDARSPRGIRWSRSTISWLLLVFAAPALASVPASEAAPTGQAGEAAETRILLPLLLRDGNNPTDPTSRPGSPTPTSTELPTATITPWPLPTSIDVLPPGAESYDLLGQAGGWSHAVAAADDLVYMGVGSRLLVVEAEDPSALEPVANYQLRGLVEQIVIRGDTLYVAAASGGLFVLDASDPRALRLLSHLPALSSSLDLALAGDIGYLAEGLDGLRVLDLSDPRDPRQIGRIESNGVSLAVSVDEAEQRLGLADGYAGLRIFDLSDCRAPMELATYREQFEILDVELAGGAGYVIEDDQTLFVVDLRAPDRPRRTMSRDPVWGCCSWDMHLGEDRLSILSIGTLLLFDPEQPSLRGMTRLPNNPTALFSRGTEVIVGMDAGHCDVVSPGPGRLSIYDLADPDSIRALGTVTVPVGIEDLAISGDHAFAAAWTDGVYVLDVSAALSPTLVSRLPLPGLARAVEIIGDRLFVDMVEPAAVGDLAFLPWRNHWGRVLVIDIANPLELQVIDSLPVGASGGLLAYRGTLWHSADESGISAWGRLR